MINLSWRRAATIAALGVCALAPATRAQTSVGTLSAELETRATLEAEATKAEAQHRTQEAWLLRQRLQKGDFQDGDRIIVRLLGSVVIPNWPDTMVVRAGKVLALPQMNDVSLDGVLRSELEPKLQSHVSKFLKDSSLRAIPLLRLYVGGLVRNPGFFYVQADVLLNDVIMRAGGPDQTADINNMIIKRGPDVIWNQQDTRTALADGLSLDRLHLRAGDEMYLDDVKAMSATDWRTIAQFSGVILGTIGLIARILR